MVACDGNLTEPDLGTLLPGDAGARDALGPDRVSPAPDASEPAPDAALDDAAPSADAEPQPDAEIEDAEPLPDAEAPDAEAVDAEPPPDAEAPDAEAPDADAPDAEIEDAASEDAEPSPDAEAPDADAPDADAPDGSPTDAGLTICDDAASVIEACTTIRPEVNDCTAEELRVATCVFTYPAGACLYTLGGPVPGTEAFVDCLLGGGDPDAGVSDAEEPIDLGGDDSGDAGLEPGDADAEPNADVIRT